MIFLFKLFVIFSSLVFIWDRSTRFLINPYKLIFVFGKKGSGKSTLLTKLALEYLKKGWNVYSSMYIPGTIYFNVDDLNINCVPQENSLVLIDEVSLIWSNRDFKNFKKNVEEYFRLQRKLKNRVVIFSQSFDVDKKIRDLCDEMYLLKSFARAWSVQRRILKKVTISHASDNASGTSSLVDDYQFDFPFFGGLKFIFIPRYIPYFDTLDQIPAHTFLTGSFTPFNDVQVKYWKSSRYYFDLVKDWFLFVFKSLAFFVWSAIAAVFRFLLSPLRALRSKITKKNVEA